MVRWQLLLGVLAAACGSPSGLDAGHTDAGRDASVALIDAGFDAGSPLDAGRDAGFRVDAGPPGDAGQFEAVDAGVASGFSDVWTDGTQAWIVGSSGLVLHRDSSGAWTSVDAGGTDFTYLTVAVDGPGRVHVGGRTSGNSGVIATSADGVSFAMVSGLRLGQGVGSIAADGTRVYASADRIVFLDGGAWDRSMPQPASGFPGALTARNGELWSTGFGSVQHFVDGGWRSEATGGELQMDVCVSSLERTVVSEHGFSAQAQANAGFAWMPWVIFDNEPVGCAYSPNGTLWLAVNSIHLDGGIHGSVYRSNGNFEFTEWTLPLLRAISASDTEVMVIGTDSVWRITP